MPFRRDPKPQEQHEPAPAESPDACQAASEHSAPVSEVQPSPKGKPGDLKERVEALLSDIRSGRKALDRGYVPGVAFDDDDREAQAYNGAGDWADMWPR